MDAVWVVSDAMPDGTYVVTVQASDDVAVALPRDRAVAYATVVYDVCARAEYDAAVLAQFTKLGMDAATAAGAVADLRAERPPVDDAVTAPLRFRPLVTRRTGLPAVHLLVGGRPVSQWSPDEARQHAGHVLDAVMVVDMDAAFRRYLVGQVGLDDGRARQVVGDLQEYRRGEEGVSGDR